MLFSCVGSGAKPEEKPPNPAEPSEAKTEVKMDVKTNKAPAASNLAAKLVQKLATGTPNKTQGLPIPVPTAATPRAESESKPVVATAAAMAAISSIAMTSSGETVHYSMHDLAPRNGLPKGLFH